jgi:hypothetical protein
LNVSPFRILQQIIFLVCFVSAFSVQATQPVGHTATVTELKTELTRLRAQHGDTADTLAAKGEAAKEKESSKINTK